MKEGQSITEFLMSYGWVILVILSAVGVIVYLNMSELCNMGSDISCDFRISQDNSIHLMLRNDRGEDLTDVSVRIAGCTESPEADGDDPWYKGTILGGDYGIMLTSCPDTLVGGVGSRVQTDIILVYTSSDGILYVKTGSLIGKVKE